MGAGRKMHSQGADYKREERTKSRVHRMAYLPLKAIHWGHIYLGGEVAHKPTLRIKGTRI
jgi:hypothetical protein